MGFGDWRCSRAIWRVCFSEKGSSSCSLFFLIPVSPKNSLLGLLPISPTLFIPHNGLWCSRIQHLCLLWGPPQFHSPYPCAVYTIIVTSHSLLTSHLSFLMFISTSILAWIVPLGYFLHQTQVSMWQLSFIFYVSCIIQVSMWMLPTYFSHVTLVSASLVSKLIAENISYILKMLPYSTRYLVTTQAIMSNYFKPISTKFSPHTTLMSKPLWVCYKLGEVPTVCPLGHWVNTLYGRCTLRPRWQHPDCRSAHFLVWSRNRTLHKCGGMGTQSHPEATTKVLPRSVNLWVHLILTVLCFMSYSSSS